MARINKDSFLYRYHSTITPDTLLSHITAVLRPTIIVHIKFDYQKKRRASYHYLFFTSGIDLLQTKRLMLVVKFIISWLLELNVLTTS